MLALIKWHIAYYLNSARYLPGLICYFLFLVINYQISPTVIGVNLHLTLIATFILANVVASGMVNTEDKTQELVTTLKATSARRYHVSQVLGVLVFTAPLYLVSILFPIVAGRYTRSLGLGELSLHVALHGVFSLLGTSLGVLFNRHLIPLQEKRILSHGLLLLIVLVPLNLILPENVLLRYAYFLLPPIYALGSWLHELGDGVMVVDGYLLTFVVHSLVYAGVLLGGYLVLIGRYSRR